MPTKEYEVKSYFDNGLPCFCHFGYISAHHTPHNPNWHKDVEVLACTKGEGFVSIDGKNVSFSKGDTVIINSFLSHQILTKSHVEYFYMLIDPTFQEQCGFLIEKLTFQTHIADKELYDCFIKIVDITHSDDSLRQLKTRLYLLEYLLMLYNNYVSFDTASKVTDDELHAKKALEFIRYNYAKPLSVSDIAEYAGIGRTRLAKEFKAYTGRALLEQINIIRCKNALKMIKEGAKISEAAASCGFENKSYFTKIYKRYNKELPTETKAKNQ